MFEKRLTLSLITCCYLNWKTSDFIWVSFTCSTRTCSTDIKVSRSTNLFPFYSLLPQVCPKVVYWARFYSFYSSTTLPMLFQTVTSISLLMISKFLPLQMSPLFRMILILYNGGVLSIASNSIPWSAKPWISVGLTKTYSWCWILIAYHTSTKSKTWVLSSQEMHLGRNISISNSWKAAESSNFLRKISLMSYQSTERSYSWSLYCFQSCSMVLLSGVLH